MFSFGIDSRFGQNVLLGFSYRNFIVVARSLKVGVMLPLCLGKYVKQLVLRLISLRSCRIAVPSDYESNGTAMKEHGVILVSETFDIDLTYPSKTVYPNLFKLIYSSRCNMRSTIIMLIVVTANGVIAEA